MLFSFSLCRMDWLGKLKISLSIEYVIFNIVLVMRGIWEVDDVNFLVFFLFFDWFGSWFIRNFVKDILFVILWYILKIVVKFLLL